MVQVIVLGVIVMSPWLVKGVFEAVAEIGKLVAKTGLVALSVSK
jgi:hypothetical protein